MTPPPPHASFTAGSGHLPGLGWLEAYGVTALRCRECLDLDPHGRVDLWLSGLDPRREYEVVLDVHGAGFVVEVTGGEATVETHSDVPVRTVLAAPRFSDMAMVRVSAAHPEPWTFRAAEVLPR